MKSFLPLLSLVLVFASCSTAYQSGQTPDDVYYSPERERAEYVRVDDEDDRRYRGQDYNRRGQDYYSYEDDRYLRMKIRNRDRWSYLDYYYRDPFAYNPLAYNYYGYNPYYSYNHGYWNPRLYWNYYYNPYGSYYNPYGPGHYYNPYAPGVIVVNPKSPTYNRPRMYNLHVFDDPKNSSVNPRVPGTRTRDYNTQGSNVDRNVGNDLRDMFRTSEGSSSREKSSTTTPSSNSGSNNSSRSSGSSNSGGNAPVRRF